MSSNTFIQNTFIGQFFTVVIWADVFICVATNNCFSFEQQKSDRERSTPDNKILQQMDKAR